MSSRVVTRELRRITSNPFRKKVISHSLIAQIETLFSQNLFREIPPKHIASILTSCSILGNDCPEVFLRSIYTSIARNLSPETIDNMSDLDFSRTVVSFGFLVKRRLANTDHTRVGSVLLRSAHTRFTSCASTSSIIRTIVKGISMMRLPLSAELISFYRDIPWQRLSSFDEKIFVCRSAIDYGLLNKSLLLALVNELPGAAVRPESAASLLYCLAMSGIDSVDPSVAMHLLNRADRVKLTPFWACHILGIELKDISHRKQIEAGLNSPDSRDRAMAELILQVGNQGAPPIRQSTKHANLMNDLERIFGPLSVEYPVTPAIVVDCASIRRKLAIELQGPSHYLVDIASGDRVLNGPTLWKNKTLRELDWEVINVDLSNPDIKNNVAVAKFVSR